MHIRPHRKLVFSDQVLSKGALMQTAFECLTNKGSEMSDCLHCGRVNRVVGQRAPADGPRSVLRQTLGSFARHTLRNCLRNCHVNPTAKLEFRGWSCPTLTTRDLRRCGQPECQSAPLPLCNQRACPPDHRSPQSVPRGRTPSHGSTSRHQLSGSGTLAQEG